MKIPMKLYLVMCIPNRWKSILVKTTTLLGANTEDTPPNIAMFENKTNCSVCLKLLETSPV